jgi:hypothetical protein
MATRRMKRIKRTKKHLHHGRRKTNRRHLRNATKRGGMLKWAAKTFSSERINKRGGPLYGGIEVFKSIVDGNPRYNIGNSSLEAYMQSSPEDKIYGELIKIILSKINTGSKIVTKGGPFEGVVFLDQAGFDTFKRQNFAAAADAAAIAVAANTIEKRIQQSLLLSPNQLRVSHEFIGYMNHAGITKAFPISQDMKKYEFDNFAINLKDKSVITGKLEVDFANPDEVNFVLTLDKPDIVKESFIKCMQVMMHESSFRHDIQNIHLNHNKIIIDGTVSETSMPGNRSLYSFEELVKKFANQYNVCLRPTMEELISELHVSPIRPLQIQIESLLSICRAKITNLTHEKKPEFESLLNAIQEIYEKNKNDMPNLNKVHELLTNLLETTNGKFRK